MNCREGVGSIDWRGDWKGTMVVGIGRGQGRHSCFDGSDNVWVLWEVVNYLGMHVQSVQLGYNVGKSLNHQWFENFYSVQEQWGRH